MKKIIPILTITALTAFMYSCKPKSGGASASCTTATAKYLTDGATIRYKIDNVSAAGDTELIKTYTEVEPKVFSVKSTIKYNDSTVPNANSIDYYAYGCGGNIAVKESGYQIDKSYTTSNFWSIANKAAGSRWQFTMNGVVNYMGCASLNNYVICELDTFYCNKLFLTTVYNPSVADTFYYNDTIGVIKYISAGTGNPTYRSYELRAKNF